MRITNNMIMDNTKTNINGNKVNVDKYNTQMTTQKKISKASENPVIAIRSLRLGTSMSHITQYLDNNIKDAASWLDVTYTALNNMKDLLTDIRTQCVNGSTDTLTADDRQTILKNLEALQDQIYTEGNADYAGRTVFTGYRTTENLTFNEDAPETSYAIEQNYTFEDLKQHRFYYGDAAVPSATDVAQHKQNNTEYTENVGRETNYRVRLAYSGAELSDTNAFMIDGAEYTDITVYDDERQWTESADFPLADDATTCIFIKSTGEMVIPKDMAEEIIENKQSMTVNYNKTGFVEGDLRPEYYFNCTLNPGKDDEVVFTLEEQEINYTISANTQLTVNTQARNVFSQDIDRDVSEMIDAVKYAIDAETKVGRIEEMMRQEQYADPESQEVLQGYLDVAKKEQDLANDNLQKLYDSYVGNFNNYLTKVNTAITNVGSMQARLSLTQNRVENQSTTVEQLKSSNEDREMSDVIIDYYAAYNAYTSSLTAASKVGEQSLLKYL